MRLSVVLAAVALGGQICLGGLNVDWMYHDDNDGVDDRATEKVPGEAFTFLANGSATVRDADSVVVYVLTANRFAGEADEQLFVRWWNGETEKWVMGEWMKNIVLGEGEGAVGRFHDLPAAGAVLLDLWRVEIGADATRPGDNYYSVQMKGWEGDHATEYYLLKDSSNGNIGSNNLGQAGSFNAGDYYGNDWKVVITE
jgi:hypothetical protein